MVQLLRVWQTVFRMGHPQVRWSVLLMTQSGGMSAQLQGGHAGVGALPLNAMECGNFAIAVMPPQSEGGRLWLLSQLGGLSSSAESQPATWHGDGFLRTTTALAGG
jgi:hypothetical protein